MSNRSYTSKADLYNFVQCMKYDILAIRDSDYPIKILDRISSIDSIEVEYHKFTTKGLCGLAFLGQKSDTIVLSELRTDLERNFDGAHEFLHITKHADEKIDHFECFGTATKATQNQALEWQANEGAAELLIPYSLLLPEIKKSFPTLKSWNDFHDFKINMARKFYVTDAVMTYRFESLKYEIFQYLSGTPLSKLKIVSNRKQLRAGVNLKSLNDMECELLSKEYERRNIDIAM